MIQFVWAETGDAELEKGNRATWRTALGLVSLKYGRCRSPLSLWEQCLLRDLFSDTVCLLSGGCLMHESTNIDIWYHSTLEATMVLLVLSPSAIGEISCGPVASWRHRLDRLCSTGPAKCTASQKTERPHLVPPLGTYVWQRAARTASLTSMHEGLFVINLKIAITSLIMRPEKIQLMCVTAAKTVVEVGYGMKCWPQTRQRPCK
jgi:hypothetical protein